MCERLPNTPLDRSADSRALAERRAGYVARKSCWREDAIDNFGGVAIIQPKHNFIVAGCRYTMTPEEVIDWCGGD